LLNAKKISERGELLSDIEKDNRIFREMIISRISKGSTYRFEFTFNLNLSFLELADSESAVAEVYTTLERWVREVATNALLVVSPQLFPQCLLTIHNWLYRSIEPFLLEVVNTDNNQSLKYASFEFIALVERMMVVNINGNMIRNFNGHTCSLLGIISNVDRYNWPYLGNSFCDLDKNQIVFGDTISSIPDMLLFDFMASKYRIMALWNIKALITMQRILFSARTNIIDVNSILQLFQDITNNFFSELGLYCLEKLQEKAKKKVSSSSFRHLVQVLSTKFVSVTAYMDFFKIVRHHFNAEDLYVDKRHITVEKLWEGLFVSGKYDCKLLVFVHVLLNFEHDFEIGKRLEIYMFWYLFYLSLNTILKSEKGLEIYMLLTLPIKLIRLTSRSILSYSNNSELVWLSFSTNAILSRISWIRQTKSGYFTNYRSYFKFLQTILYYSCVPIWYIHSRIWYYPLDKYWLFYYNIRNRSSIYRP